MADLYSQFQRYEKGQAQKLPTTGTVSGIDGPTVDVLVRGSSTILRSVKTIGTASATGQAVVLSWENGIPTAHIMGGLGSPAEISAISRGPAGPAGTNGTNGAQGPQGEQGPQGPAGSLEAGSPITQLELIATPSTPPIGFMSIYPKTDHKFYKLDANGVETELGSGAGAIAHALAMATNDFLVASGAGAFVKKTLAETIAILRTVLDSVYAAASHLHTGVYSPLTWGWVTREETWTRTANHQFYVPGDMTQTYRKAARLTWTDSGGGKYGVIGSSSFSGGVTYVNLITSDIVMAASAITSRAISYDRNPAGFPAHFTWTPTGTGWTKGNATVYGVWNALDGNTIEGFIYFAFGAAPSGVAIGDPYFAPPVAVSSVIPSYYTMGEAALIDYGVGLYMGEVINQGGSMNVRCIAAGGTYAVWTYLSASAPFTWGANDYLVARFKYFY